jgi:adenylosuccinate synthase
MPGDTSQFSACEPVYEKLPGWQQPTRGVTEFSKLPIEAQRYVARLEETSGVKAAIVSTGSERNHTVIRDKPLIESTIG